MIDVKWKELEDPLTIYTQDKRLDRFFRLRLFRRLREKLNKDDNPLTIINVVTDSTKDIAENTSIKDEEIINALSTIIDFIFLYIKSPWINFITRPIIKRVILFKVRRILKSTRGK